MVVVGAIAFAALVSLPFVGRWERNRNAAVQNRAMDAVFRRATSDGLVSRRLWRYRLNWSFDCLVYKAQSDPTATSGLELCFDPRGRLIETIDRVSGTAHFGSLIEQPTLATLTVPVPTLLRAFAAAGAFRDPRLAGVSPARLTSLPVGFYDIGAFHAEPKKRKPAP